MVANKVIAQTSTIVLYIIIGSPNTIKKNLLYFE